MTFVSHYCQKCLAANELGRDFCSRCGTRLMIVVEPAAARYENVEPAVLNEEHLLERISGLENRQVRLTEKLERALDLLLRQAQNSHFDRALIKSLAGLLADDGIIESDRLERLWITRCQRDAEEQQDSERREALRLKILARFSGGDRAAFENRLNQGFLLIEDDQASRGIRALQRAADFSPNNAPLLSLLGELFYKSGKSGKARSFLSQAYEIEPGDKRLQLLLGLTCADEGERERAKTLLQNATQVGASSFAAHFGLGQLFVAEERWDDAVREFKSAIARRASPEAHYALGRLYYGLRRDSLAGRHLRKAIALDQSYHEALHLLGLVCERGGQKAQANKYFARAGTGTFVSSPSASRPKRQTERAAADIESGFRMSVARSRKLVTEADRRLAEALKEDALKYWSGSERIGEAQLGKEG